MGLYLIGFLFIFMSSLVGFLLARQLDVSTLVGVTCGFLGAILLLLVVLGARRISFKNLGRIILGLLVGLVIGGAISYGVSFLIPREEIILVVAMFIIALSGSLGILIAAKQQEIASFIGSYIIPHMIGGQTRYKILDTSAIIDGRIADIIETGFMEGTIIIPHFVLRELQQVADSSDPLKRNRGRRGLDILNRIQKSERVKVKFHDKDFPGIRGVDGKLIKLASLLRGKVITNDYNLNKVAELQGITVLNINDLANAVKPIVLPGEVMNIRIIKDGKEYGQGIGYLDDGTMVVVENGRNFIGQSIDVLVTSILQTAAGRMIFTRPKGEEE